MNSNNIYQEKKRFTAIDVLIIFSVLLLIATLIFRSQLISLFNDSSKRIDCEIYIVCENVSNEITPQIKDGSDVYWVESKVPVGKMTLTSQFSPAAVYTNENGNLYVEYSDSASTFSGKIDAAAVSNSGCYLNGTDFIAPGMNLTFSTEYVQFTALITDIKFI